METVTGIFRNRADAEKAVQELYSRGIKNDRIALLTPKTSEPIEESVLTSDTEQPGMGSAMGGAVGGAMGAAGGATVGAAAASLLVPGVGPVIAGTILGAAILGVGGAVTGAAAGGAMEDSIAKGLPRDEVYIYEDAVRQGRSVVIAFAENDDQEDGARAVLSQAGAETIDQARETWWLGLRDAEAESYSVSGRTFSDDEANYRRGFEAALNRLGQTSHDAETDEAFRSGYQRGESYQQSIRERYAR